MGGVTNEVHSLTRVVQGVSAADKEKFLPINRNGLETFVCFDSGAADDSIPFDAVNDDFCDCADGSDEPGTAACAGHTTHLFYCPNEGSLPLYIYPSRVNDGLCDCCDGSDEWKAMMEWPTKCPNVCEQDSKEIAKLEATWREGRDKRNALIKEASSEHSKVLQELDRLRALLPSLEIIERARNSALEAVNLCWDTEKALQGRLEDEVPAAVGTPVKESVEDTQAIQGGQVMEGADKVEKNELEKVEVVSEYAKWMEGADKLQKDEVEKVEVLSEKKEVKNVEVVSEYAKWMEDADKVETDEVELQTAEVDEYDTSLENVEVDKNEVVSGEADGGGFRQKLWERLSDLSQLPHLVWSQIWGEAVSPLEDAVNSMKDAHEEMSEKLRETKKRIQELESLLSNYNDDHAAYAGLEGKCVKKHVTQYTYEVCFFKDAKQDTVSLGTFKNWESADIAFFDGGRTCHGGIQRNLRVKFLCGLNEELVDVYEPNSCSYEATMHHVGACRGDLFEATRRARMPTDEL